MALYLIDNYLVRARNGLHAKELANSISEPTRVTEDGEHGVVSTIEVPAVESAPVDENPSDDEIDVTELADRGVRKYRSTKTGKTRAVRKP